LYPAVCVPYVTVRLLHTVPFTGLRSVPACRCCTYVVPLLTLLPHVACGYHVLLYVVMYRYTYVNTFTFICFTAFPQPPFVTDVLLCDYVTLFDYLILRTFQFVTVTVILRTFYSYVVLLRVTPLPRYCDCGYCCTTLCRIYHAPFCNCYCPFTYNVPRWFGARSLRCYHPLMVNVA